MQKEDIIKELKWRGLISNITDEKKLLNIIKKNNDFAIYVGFDPSFKSLHLGNYVMIRILKMFKKYGFRTIALVGGGTGMIGDPSGKNSERNLLNKEQVLFNSEAIAKQIKKYSDSDEIFNNIDIWSKMSVVEFLRDVSKSFQVNRMLEKEIVKNRLSDGISYTEFSYSILQSYDWKVLYETKNVFVQIGGSDQWGNITAGTDFIRKVYGDKNNAVGLTINLLLKKDGKKFGKSESGALYLDREITNPFEIYQYIIKQDDSDLEKLFKFLTSYNEKEIKEILLEHVKDPKKRFAHKKIAENIITEIHSKQDFLKCEETAVFLFKEDYKNIEEKTLLSLFHKENHFKLEDANKPIIEILNELKIFSSKREIREFFGTNSITINGEKTSDYNFIYKKEDLINSKYLILKKGKKTFILIELF
ncbi:MAG: tyrosine--tRNA ligase [Metamycoplasmataceae bacterium]